MDTTDTTNNLGNQIKNSFGNSSYLSSYLPSQSLPGYFTSFPTIATQKSVPVSSANNLTQVYREQTNNQPIQKQISIVNPWGTSTLSTPTTTYTPTNINNTSPLSDLPYLVNLANLLGNTTASQQVTNIPNNTIVPQQIANIPSTYQPSGTFFDNSQQISPETISLLAYLNGYNLI